MSARAALFQALDDIERKVGELRPQDRIDSVDGLTLHEERARMSLHLDQWVNAEARRRAARRLVATGALDEAQVDAVLHLRDPRDAALAQMAQQGVLTPAELLDLEAAREYEVIRRERGVPLVRVPVPLSLLVLGILLASVMVAGGLVPMVDPSATVAGDMGNLFLGRTAVSVLLALLLVRFATWREMLATEGSR